MSSSPKTPVGTPALLQGLSPHYVIPNLTGIKQGEKNLQMKSKVIG